MEAIPFIPFIPVKLYIVLIPRWYIMPKSSEIDQSSKAPRVEITEKALKVLKIETALSGLNQKTELEALILRGASSRTLALVDEKPLMENDVQKMAKIPKKEIETVCQPKGEIVVCEPKQKRLSENPDALQKIRELWSQDPRPSYAEIGRIIGYKKPTVFEKIKRMIKNGELLE